MAKLKLDENIARSDIWYYPGEELAPDQMRVTLMGTGWGNIIRPNQKGASIYIELGNGDTFLFDAGPGCCVNYNVMQVPFSRMTRVFLTHLHTDHCSDLDWIYTFGPSVDRFTPMHIYGPHNYLDKPCSQGVAIPDMIEFVRGLKQSTHWHTVSFEATLNVGKAYEIKVYPLDYRSVPPRPGAGGDLQEERAPVEPQALARQDVPDGVKVMPQPAPGIAYQDRDQGVTISHWPALHVIDGAISYCLEWNGYKVVWSGDTKPNHYMLDHAAGADLLIHETAPSVERFVQAQNDTEETAQRIIEASHTPARALGKILSITDPTLAVTCHSPIDPEEWESYVEEVRDWWIDTDGSYQIGEDLMVFTLSKPEGETGKPDKPARNEVSVRKGYLHERPWGVRVATNHYQPEKKTSRDPRPYKTDIFDQVLQDAAWKMPNVEGLERKLEEALLEVRRHAQQHGSAAEDTGEKDDEPGTD